ncbi:MAG TPA: hypothetical protein VLF93_00685 [Candidatus Saccharimonadales bacterium]|nr:hypothetical protein [Candidatus Saccharimonadales bacterium]
MSHNTSSHHKHEHVNHQVAKPHSHKKEAISLIITNIVLIILLAASIYFIVQTTHQPTPSTTTHAVKKGGDR